MTQEHESAAAVQMLQGTEASEPPASLSVDEIIERSVGRLKFTQFIQAMLASSVAFFDSQQTYISVFAHAQPAWHHTADNTSKSSICSMSKTDWAWNSTKIHTSIISEWDLECASPFLTGFPTTSYFLGCLLGGILFAMLGDSSLGRKNLLCLSSLIMSISAFLSAFSPNIWVYAAFRFLSGAGRAPLAVSALVLLTERVGKRWRSQIAMVGFIHFSLGILALTGIAYLTRGHSWRVLYLCTSIPGIICSILCYFFLCESPRWLFIQGRQKDAMDVLKALGSTNQISSIDSLNIDIQQKMSTNSLSASLKILITRRWAVKRLLASMILSFGVGLMYFGMFLSVGNMGWNIYLTATFSALLSLSSYLLTFLFWIERCNRRTSLLGFCSISGATSVIFSVLANKSGSTDVVLLTTLELISLFCGCMAYNLVLMYTVELFPTCVRNSASSLVRQAMVFGSVFDPVLILIGRKNKMYSYGVFGIVMIVSGLMAICLPETKGKGLCDTMEEQESRDNESNTYTG